MKLNYRYFVVLGTAAIGLSAASVTEVTIHEEKPFPESLSSTSDGSLYIGSLAKGEVFKAAKGAATAEVWIKPGTNGLQRVLGVLADPKSGTLWVCSSKLPPQGAPLRCVGRRPGKLGRDRQPDLRAPFLGYAVEPAPVPQRR